MHNQQQPHLSKTKRLDAALQVFRTHAYTVNRVDDVCRAAGGTKGNFFHHFTYRILLSGVALLPLSAEK
ncbi:MAG: TetR/AcrR family transcriptional regulator [Undibacterium sp.]|uniref:TetR/AcrR family transcriptional regulator n=1 Tax=Undibacterium sp. TaxID=1914977 RepID=UPI002728EB6C|nr:TetR/AcrR family transcriptional regulator [Undibacterium sp.]MDO8654803.1 TetR/AcrR family transcriptional regulator [Undibacterium sp.]